MFTGHVTKVLVTMIAIGVLVLRGINAAEAKLVEWLLQDATFDDGGTATGFFILDGEGQALPNFDIKVRGGTRGIPAFDYTPLPLHILIAYL